LLKGGFRSGEYLGDIERRAARLYRLANTDSLVCRQVVDHDDVLAFERRGKTLFDIGKESFLSLSRQLSATLSCHVDVARP
jgi:hypothetical protein